MTQSEIPQALELATQHHQAGRLEQAETIYRQVLAVAPANPDALQLLGVLALQTGKVDVAIDLIGKAVAMSPNSPHFLCNYGQALSAAGRYDEAIAKYRRALDLQPDLADAHNSIGNALFHQRQLPEAIDAFRRSIALRPGFAEAHSNLGNALAASGRHDVAIASFHQALALKPNSAMALTNLGSSLQAKGQFNEAMAALRQAVALQPNLAEAHNNLGIILQTAGRLEQAIASYRQALSLRPDLLDARNNLGSALQEIGQPEQAIAEFRAALAAHPDFPEVYNNLGGALREIGKTDEAIAAFRQAIVRQPDFYEPTINLGAALHAAGHFDEAIDTFRRAIELKPDRPIAHVNLGIGLLLKGDMQHGWPEYEWRWKAGELRYPHDDSGKPMWDGRKLGGQRILLESEQGFGDTIQFVRYLPLVAQRGARITLTCRPELTELLRINLPNVHVAPRGEPFLEFDTHCPLLSLPRIFATTLETIPAPIPYLRADPAKSQNWKKRLSQFSEPRKVGLVWAGRAEHRGDRNRSLSPTLLAPIFQASEARFVSLQKSPKSSPPNTLPSELPCVDWTQELDDFSDTAALIDQLDLVITIDSAVAHLAAAMGKPTWVLLPSVPDWRWMLNQSDSPWYPTVRLFRQGKLGDWTGVISEIAESRKSAFLIRLVAVHVGLKMDRR